MPRMTSLSMSRFKWKLPQPSSILALLSFILFAGTPLPSQASTIWPSQADALRVCEEDIPYAQSRGETIVAACTGPVISDAGNPSYYLGTMWNGIPSHTYWEWYGSLFPYKPAKNNGRPCSCAGDPINLGTGNEYRDEVDAALGDLSFHRYYNSDNSTASAHIGAHWRHNFDVSLTYVSGGTNSNATVTVYRPSGQQITFTLQSGAWTTDPDVADRLTQQTDASGNLTGWTYFDADTRNQESFDANGLLLSITTPANQATTFVYSTVATPTSIAPVAGLLLTVTDPHGRALNFTYNANATVNAVTQADGGVLSYSYDANGNLTQVTYPDKSTKQYVYNESTLTSGQSFPNALTGDIDETGTRLTSIGYNAQNQAILSSLAGNVDTTQVSYNANSLASTTSVTYPNGAQTTLSFAMPNGSVHTSAVSAACGPDCGQPNQAATFDANGYVASTTDFNGNLTKTTYDANGLLDVQIDASGTAQQRTTATTWNTALRVPLTRTMQDNNGNTVASTAWVYNSTGQTLARCEIDPANAAAAGYACSNTGSVPAGVRRSTYTYCTAVDTTQCPIVGLLLTATGPRTDLTQTATYHYYLTDSATAHHGDLQSVTDALGHTTTFLSYDGAGRVLSLQDTNGVVTTLTYYPRGWLKTRSVGGATTSFIYTAYGAVQTVTDPDNVTVTYGYDTAHRLTTVTDAQGNYVQYTLDAAGNRTAENTYAAGSSTASRTLTRQFNTLGQLTKLIDGLNHTVFDASASGNYDANNNLVQSADANGIAQQNSYDALNRLVKAVANYNGTDTATKNTTTQSAYDALDRLTQVIDPSNLATTYGYDGLSNATSLQSPDTGTSSTTYDAAGNVLTHTDAKGIVSTSIYDALNRLTGTSYSDSAQTNDNATYAYDEANSVTGCASSYPLGRLTRIVESAVTTVYCYDARGNVTRKQQITSAGTDTTAYTYTSADRLSGITYPSGTQAGYTFDADGRIQSVTLTPPGGSASTAVSSVSYLPLGPISSYTLGNGQTVTRTYDTNYALTDLTSPALNLHFARDLMGNISAEGNTRGANPATESYTYDPLYHLKSIDQGSTNIEALTYNPTGDRTSKAGGGLATGTYAYNVGTHQLTSTGSAAWTLDANGNTTGNASAGQTWGYGYNGRHRLTVVQANGATVGTYTYNALGQRVQKVATQPVASTERFNYDEAGRLTGEYGSNTRDYVWLGGMPIATVDTAGSASTVSYVVADHLGTPRAVTDGSGNALWTWAFVGNPFGELAPTSSNGYTLNLRYPGQYFDAESGLVHNGHRDYNVATGRYIQSDPSGLNGGISTYAYTGSNPLQYVDSLGLQETNVELPPEAATEGRGDEITPAESFRREQAGLEEALKEEANGTLKQTPLVPPSWEYNLECRPGDLDRDRQELVGPPGGAQVTVNYWQGRLFEESGISYLKTVETNVQTQVAVRPYTDAQGTLADYFVRVDAIGENQSGDVVLSEFKSSPDASFTANQNKGYPLIGLYGGQVIGENGGSIYPAGTVIKPSPVQVYRPGSF